MNDFKMNKDDLSAELSTSGYMLYYKGVKIGGAGIQGKFKGRGRSRTKQINDYRNMAIRDIDQIMNGEMKEFNFDINSFYEINKILPEILDNFDIEYNKNIGEKTLSIKCFDKDFNQLNKFINQKIENKKTIKKGYEMGNRNIKETLQEFKRNNN